MKEFLVTFFGGVISAMMLMSYICPPCAAMYAMVIIQALFPK